MTLYAGAVATVSDFNAAFGRVIARARRTTDSSTTTTEGGVLRLDSVAVSSGGLYLVVTSPLGLDSSVTNDEIFAQIRYSSSGTASTSSTQLPGSRINTRQTDANVEEHKVILTTYAPAADETLSLLLTVGRIAGTGNCRLVANLAAIDLTVVSIGTDPGNTGVSI